MNTLINKLHIFRHLLIVSRPESSSPLLEPEGALPLSKMLPLNQILDKNKLLHNLQPQDAFYY
jgi:hypothetical protein